MSTSIPKKIEKSRSSSGKKFIVNLPSEQTIYQKIPLGHGTPARSKQSFVKRQNYQILQFAGVNATKIVNQKIRFRFLASIHSAEARQNI